MTDKVNVVKPSSLDVKTICWLASKKAIMSVTPGGKTAFIKQATLDEMPDIYIRAALKN